MKNQVANLYNHQDKQNARGIARAYLSNIVAAMSEIEGKEVAATVLFDATDALLANIQVTDLPHLEEMRSTPAQPMMAKRGEPEELWQWGKFYRCIGWATLGFFLHSPIVALYHLVTG